MDIPRVVVKRLPIPGENSPTYQLNWPTLRGNGHSNTGRKSARWLPTQVVNDKGRHHLLWDRRCAEMGKSVVKGFQVRRRCRSCTSPTKTLLDASLSFSRPI